MNENTTIKTESVVLIFSHSNYLKGSGGTEKCVIEQTSRLLQQGVGSLHVFPSNSYSFLGKQSALYGVNRNDRFLGFFTPLEISRKVAELRSLLVSVYVHHLMAWQYVDFKQIVASLDDSSIPRVYFAHDFYSCCSSAFLPCLNPENGEFCQASDVLSTHFSTCRDKLYSEHLREWRGIFREIFTWADEIIVPSEFVKQTLAAVFPHFEHKILAWGHLHLSPIESRSETAMEMNRATALSEKPRIAYLGYKAEHKGWGIWTTIFNDPRLLQQYELFHLGSTEQYSPYVTSVSYTYHDGGSMAAVRALERYRIDCVVLLSVVPESYSYTLYESIAAGIPILTTNRSGNIAQVLRESQNSTGLVLDSAAELIEFLSDASRVKLLMHIPRQKYRIESSVYLGATLSRCEDAYPGEISNTDSILRVLSQADKETQSLLCPTTAM